MSKKTIDKKAISILLHKVTYHYDNGQDMPETEQEHVAYMITQGYSAGELNDSDEVRGWWEIEKPYRY